jgi:outer membrane receptor for monomeric catechols
MNNPRFRGSFTQKDAEAKKLKLVVADYGEALAATRSSFFGWWMK